MTPPMTYRKWNRLPAKVEIIIDTNEQREWRFPATTYVYAPRCPNRRDLVQITTRRESLRELGADYAVFHGDFLVTGVERKGSASEVAKNMLTCDFRRTKASLTRLSACKARSWLIFDFAYPVDADGQAACAAMTQLAGDLDLYVMWLHSRPPGIGAGRIVADLLLATYADYLGA